MNNQTFVIGIDGGGTKTNAVLCSLDGSILAEAQGGASNILITGVDNTAHIILDLVEQCCHTIGCEIEQIGSVVAGFAGAGREANREQLKNKVLILCEERTLTLKNIFIETDARIALEGALGGRPGILVLAGTGSIVMGKDERGKIYRAGGWGRIIGDEGSGYTIGREALRVLAAGIDGDKRKTTLTKRIAAQFHMDSRQSIIDAVYMQNFDLASLAPIVLEAAKQGDAIAKGILKKESERFVRQVSLLITKMRKKKTRLALAGGILANKSVYAKIICGLIKKQFPHIVLHETENSPVMGAALLALRSIKH